VTTYEVIALDWQKPNDVVASFEDRGSADRYAERMDGLALRCYVREAVHVTEPTPWEGDCVLQTVKHQPRCRVQCPNCRILDERRRGG
jgi:hypothetical protein